jgi:hypothetical protein
MQPLEISSYDPSGPPVCGVSTRSTVTTSGCVHSSCSTLSACKAGTDSVPAFFVTRLVEKMTGRQPDGHDRFVSQKLATTVSVNVTAGWLAVSSGLYAHTWRPALHVVHHHSTHIHYYRLGPADILPYVHTRHSRLQGTANNCADDPAQLTLRYVLTRLTHW